MPMRLNHDERRCNGQMFSTRMHGEPPCTEPATTVVVSATGYNHDFCDWHTTEELAYRPDAEHHPIGQPDIPVPQIRYAPNHRPLGESIPLGVPSTTDKAGWTPPTTTPPARYPTDLLPATTDPLPPSMAQVEPPDRSAFRLVQWSTARPPRPLSPATIERIRAGLDHWEYAINTHTMNFRHPEPGPDLVEGREEVSGWTGSTSARPN